MSAWVAPAAAVDTRACSCDRAGYGRSEPSDRRTGGESTAKDLHTLLEVAGEQGPYVLAGRSTGAVYGHLPWLADQARLALRHFWRALASTIQDM